MKDNPVAGCFGWLVFVGIVIVVGVVANGFALATMWGWFIAPVFSVPALTTVQAMGISSVVAFLVPTVTTKKKEEKKDTSEAVVELIMIAIGRPAFALFIGYIIFQFM